MNNYCFEIGYSEGIQSNIRNYFVGYYVINKDCPSEQSMRKELGRRIMDEIVNLDLSNFRNMYRKLEKVLYTPPNLKNGEEIQYCVEFSSAEYPYITYGGLTTIFDQTANKMLKDHDRLTKNEWLILD
jgi:hypothetical protein